MKLLLIVIIVLCCFHDFVGQPIYTRDMVLLGSQDDVYEDCLGEERQNYLYVNNRIINKHFFCKCVIAELIPKIRFEVLKQAIDSSKLDELFLQDKYFKVIDPCMKYYAEIENAYSFDHIETSEENKQLYIDICIENLEGESFSSDTIPLQTIKDYCECEVTTMINNGYSLDQIFEMEKEDSEAFNEIVVPCLNETMAHILNLDSNSGYSADDIRGDNLISYVKLIDYLGLGYKVKISIGGITKYYIFDTGATFLVINSDVEQELFSSGSISFDSYKGTTEVMLANNEIIESKLVELNNVTIGDYTIDHVTAAIIDGGSLLCGHSLLNKFKKWEIDTEQKQLILYK